MTRPSSSFKPPSSVTRKVTNLAPTRTVSENWGRSGGFYGDEDLTTAGFDSVLLYVRKGLGHMDILQPVINLALEVQNEVGIRWPLVPLSYGWGNTLKHLGTDIIMGYVNDWGTRERLAKKVCGLAGEGLEPGIAIVPQLFPQTDVRSLYGGKVRVTDRDLLIIVDVEGSVRFHPRIRDRLRSGIRKRMVLLEVTKDLSSGKWSPAPWELLFSEESGDLKERE